MLYPKYEPHLFAIVFYFFQNVEGKWSFIWNDVIGIIYNINKILLTLFIISRMMFSNVRYSFFCNNYFIRFKRIPKKTVHVFI